MIDKSFDAIDKDYIQSLVTDRVRECLTIDYKQDLPGSKDADKREFLADVSSFANAAGGYIIYGIEEERDPKGKPTGIPKAIVGIGSINIDAEILALEGTIRTGIDPRLRVRSRAIDGLEPGPVLLVRIPQSPSSPHMIRGTPRFYTRNSNGKQPLDAHEIRAAFAASEAVPRRIRAFRDDRLAKIVADETPVPLQPGAKLVLHILPVSAFSAPSITSFTVEQLWEHLEGIKSINIDGLLRVRHDGRHAVGYTQYFRDGTIESVITSIFDRSDGGTWFRSRDPEEYVVVQLRDCLPILEKLAVVPPILVMLTMLNVKGVTMVLSTRSLLDSRPVDRNILPLPECVFESYELDPATHMRSTFDAIWNACGLLRSLHYNDRGEWKLSC